MVFKLKTYYIKTFGCQMNEKDSDDIALALEKKGYIKAPSWQQADIIIINTCSVRQSAEDRVMGLVNNISKHNQTISRQNQKHSRYTGGSSRVNIKPKIVLTGCMLRYSRQELQKMLPKVDKFVKLKDLINEHPESRIQHPEDNLHPSLFTNHQSQNHQPSTINHYPSSIACPPKFRQQKDFGWVHHSFSHAWLKIMEGCDNFCTYCVVPYARGREVSRPMAEVINEAKELVKKGVNHITLLGQNVNSYGKNFNKPKKANKTNLANMAYKSPFAKLLIKLHQLKGLQKISFLTSNPHDLTDDIIKALKLPKIDRYLHLAVQSGDDEILKKMNRKYTSSQFLNLINRIRKAVPEIEIGTDIIVGFPGETEKQFQNTVELCKKAGFKVAYIGKYSPRSGTPAYKLKDNIPIQEKKRRWVIINKLVNKK